MLLVTPLSSQNKHRYSKITTFKPFPVSDDQSAIAASRPTVVLALTALPEVMKGALTVIHSEMIPADLLCDQRLHSISNQQSVMHQLRRLLTPLGRQVETKFVELNAIKAHPATVSQQNR